MTLDAYIRALRSGHETRANLLIQITSHDVIDDMAANPGSYTYPILSGHNGVLKLSQRRQVDPDGSIYNPGIIRCTGLGETFNDLKIGSPNNTAGTLAYVMDDSPLMLEVRAIDWLADKFEARMDIDGSGWANAEPVFEGQLLDGSEDAGVMSFRISSVVKLLDERIYHEQWDNNSVITQLFYRNIVFGDIYEMPVPVHPSFQVIGDYVYYSATGAYAINNAAVVLYDEGQYGDLIATPQTDWGVGTVATDSDGWTLNGSNTPVNHVYADVQGYDRLGSPGYANLRTAGAILKEAISISGASDGVNNVPILFGRAIDTASLDTVASKNDLICGINFAGHDLQHIDPSFPWDGVTVHGTEWSWLSVFSDFMGSSLCLFSVQRDGSIAFHYLLSTPAESPVLTIGKSDFVRYTKSRCIKYKYVFANTDNIDQDTSPEADFYRTYPERVAIHEGKFLAWTPIKTTEFDKAKSYITGRFGTHDYRFLNCPVAKALNIGDVVTFSADIDDYLDGSKKGYVIAIDRGTEPYIEVRA